MDRNESSEKRYKLLEQSAVLAFFFCQAATLARFVHTARYPSALWTAQQEAAGHPPPIFAPEVYRVALPPIVRGISQLLRQNELSLAFGVVDFIFCMAALWVLYCLLVEGLPLSARKQRMTRIALFLAFVQFPIQWVVPWSRPETTPSALYLALALFALVRSRSRSAWIVLLLGATVWQAFVRADVAFVFGLALLISDVLGSLRELGSRRRLALLGAAVCAIAGGVQAYLQFVRFKGVGYSPDAPPVMLSGNLSPHNLFSALLGLLPFLIAAPCVWHQRRAMVAQDKLAITAAGLYLPLWFTVAILDEVRIYVPFLMLICVPVARAVEHRFVGTENRTAEASGIARL